MTEPEQKIIFDACTLENFSAVGRIDLLQKLYRDRCSWTTGIELEVKMRAALRPDLQLLTSSWLGKPFDTDDVEALRIIDRVRRQLGGSPSLPKQHFGEAQAIYCVETAKVAGVFATDDRAAYELARRRGLNVMDTVDIVAACHDAHLLGCPEAFGVLLEMASHTRGVMVPPSHWYVCPPVRNH